MSQYGRESERQGELTYNVASKCLVLMVLWTWCESFEVLAGVNITVLGCDIVWFGRHALKFWKKPATSCSM